MPVLLVVIIVLGFLLRFVALGEHGISPDEAQFIWVASAESLSEVWRLDTRISPHPPGHFLLTHAILQYTDSSFWLRLPSVLGGTAVIWLLHRFAFTLFGPGVALAAAFLAAFSPALVDLSRVCRNYGVGFLLLVASLVFLVTFLKRERWRDYLFFSLTAVLAVFWHYGFVVAYVGIDLALAGILLLRRSSLADWGRVVALQLPLAAALLFLWVEHVSGLGQSISLHQKMHAQTLGSGVLIPWKPIEGVWWYLLREPAAVPFVVLSVVAIVDLWRRRRREELILLVTPVLLAYGAGLAVLMPFGETRQSAYIFPFLFILVASQAPRLVNGYRRPPDAAGESGPGALRVGLGRVAIGVLGALVLYSSLSFQLGDKGWTPQGPSRRREAMTSYPQAGLDRAFDYLASHAGPNDVVLLSFESLFTLRMQYGLPPLVDPTPEQIRDGDIRIEPSASPLRYERDGVRYLWARETRVVSHPAGLRAGLASVRSYFDLPRPDRVWAVRAAWEPALADIARGAEPDLEFDREVEEATDGLLFAIDTDELYRAAPAAGRRRRGRP